MKRRIIGAGIALLLGLTGCTSPVQLALDETPQVRTVRADRPTERQALVFASIVDLRPEYQRGGVGSVGGREINSGDLLSWIDRSLQKLQGQNFAARPAATAEAWQVAPRLRHFYTAGLAVTKNANVVLELEIRSPDGTTTTRVYRGRVNALNWWNSAGEIEGSVVNALGDCLQRITHDLDRLTGPAPKAGATARSAETT